MRIKGVQNETIATSRRIAAQPHFSKAMRSVRQDGCLKAVVATNHKSNQEEQITKSAVEGKVEAADLEAFTGLRALSNPLMLSGK